jgi:hypothetical protein
MTLIAQHHDKFDLGRERILEDLIEEMMGAGIDLRSLALTWHHDPLQDAWVLTARRGKNRYALRFADLDVLSWPDHPSITAKYGAAIRGTVEEMRSSENASQGSMRVFAR